MLRAPRLELKRRPVPGISMSRTAPLSKPAPRVRRWQVTAILTLFFTAVAGAAAIGWWYARESPPHQGPIVLISVEGLRPTALPVYGAEHAETPGIDALADQSIVF